MNKNTIVNLSSFPLTDDHAALLDLGPGFCPTPGPLAKQQLVQDCDDACRRVRWREYHYDPEEPPRPCPTFYKPTGRKPPTGRNQALDAYCATLLNRVDNYQAPRRPRDNLSAGLRKALRELKNLVTQRKIRISVADKGGAVVVQDTTKYIAEIERQLSNEGHYVRVKDDPTCRIAKASNALVDELFSANHIAEETKIWALVEPNSVLCHRLYTLPKIHKTLVDPPGRPIVSGVNGPTEKLSKLVDSWLQPSVRKVPSYIQDTTHMLRTIEQWNHDYGPFNNSVKLVTIDVVGLYTNIPHDEIETALRFHLQGGQVDGIPPTDKIIQVVDHILKNNVFKFEDRIFKQIFGTAMGTPMAPSVAILFMAWLEKRMLAGSPVPIQEDNWRRFIDDIIMLWTGTEEELEQFTEYINGFHRSIKFTMQSSSESISFLDITISLRNGYLHTDRFYKETDTHAYLHYKSCHPPHVKKNIPYSQFLSLRRLCSDEETFYNRCDEMEGFFKARGYKTTDVTTGRRRAAIMSRAETLQYRNKEQHGRTPFVVSYHPFNPPVRHWLTELQDSTINENHRMSEAMPLPPVVGERACTSLRRTLMPSCLPPPQEDEDPGCVKCTKRCTICDQHLVETASFRSNQTGETFTIRRRFSCTTTNLVYLLFCDTCPNAQYVGQTKNTLYTRFTQHRSDIRRETGTLVTQHFGQPSHTLSNLKCVVIERVNSDTVTARLKRESFWMCKLKTVTPDGLNTRDN
eukprot:TRINITY_DN13285_c0_g1_i1.p1 TRINITY_DN13285_c0_g1~~TRINITY_DN13285_c0_g1_i1.p1  ORF type:complete len:744 (-),score=124.94 TRINITY_DN13285_c0_g1_i1:151-2382(-)